jgi:hypothetical protein
MGGVVMPSKEAVAREKEFAQKALELDPELPEAHLLALLAVLSIGGMPRLNSIAPSN